MILIKRLKSYVMKPYLFRTMTTDTNLSTKKYFPNPTKTKTKKKTTLPNYCNIC